LKTDGPFRIGRKWYSQFFSTPDDSAAIRAELNGIVHTEGMATPAQSNHNIDAGLPF